MKANLALIISALILFGLLVSLLVGTETAEVAGAPSPHSTYYPGDPYTTVYYPTEIPPPNDTKPPIVTIISPVNNLVIASNNLTLTGDMIVTIGGLVSFGGGISVG